ncbi:DUF6468 domain-containing protein [Phenylobacterium sp. SCN 70-31]|uniref:DUF6468 domain-containing protein n=1 Tax=Phenylobacterium sp. SCN 70-31 TaxID=1660129 RepID=UPI00086CA6DF|nr:DUF6468 domain-containing protein [Phenylobacterium sp. SCN 70-31]ODT88691.1 MAG: hypothetical protein ABS78_05905 [Phenylobacterium sp. SCN 70-31]
MSLIAIGLNVLLAALLIAAMAVGVRLNRRLKALRDSHEGFEAAVRELNHAAARAEQGLADLRAATDEAVDMLSDRIEKGRALATRLEKLVSSAPEAPRPFSAERAVARGLPPVTPAPRVEDTAEQRLGALLAMARSRLQVEGAAEAERARPAAAATPARVTPMPRRAAHAADEDLFEDAPAFDRFAGVVR